MNFTEHFTPAELAQHFTYVPETGDVLWVGTGKHRPAGVACGSLDKEGYLRVRFQSKQIACHRLAWALFHGEWPKGLIDHINRNPADNRIENLRVVTDEQNSTNRVHKNRHGLRGIAKLPSGRWQAQANIGGVSKYLGTHATKEAAHDAYMRYVAPQRGDFLPRECNP